MAALDPTFPLYPIVCVLSSISLLLVLMTTFVRQSWNLGVAFLCFWLPIETLILAVDTIVWADNADVKLYVYCDIATRIQIIGSIVRPMCTLIIARRLSLIASLRSVELTKGKGRRLDIFLEWMLGLGIPLLVAGPFCKLYNYIVQETRFMVHEGFGCTSSEVPSVATILLVNLWSILPPLISITVYCPKIIRSFYLHGKEVNRFLRSNNSVSNTMYIRIILLASLDFLFTLPPNLTNLALEVSYSVRNGGIPFYPGWHIIHTNWAPEVVFNTPPIRALDQARIYFESWYPPVMAIVIFALFGLTTEARASYWRILHTIGGWFGWKPTVRSQSAMGTMEFGERPQDMSLDAEMG
ncbi:fungal pheromone STE3G-protein-coupled receptor [Peniophora sp. CONT]|nr:fungal pheromone STE3G-protein-coupled receptor [Peniophora sp. CONT]